MHRSTRPASTSDTAVALLPGLRRGQYSTIAHLAQLDAVDGGTFRYVWSLSLEVLRVRRVSDVSARPLDVCFAIVSSNHTRGSHAQGTR
jgi:hypothetical protein